jgi:hypothetical protein
LSWILILVDRRWWQLIAAPEGAFSFPVLSARLKPRPDTNLS